MKVAGYRWSQVVVNNLIWKYQGYVYYMFNNGDLVIASNIRVYFNLKLDNYMYQQIIKTKTRSSDTSIK